MFAVSPWVLLALLLTGSQPADASAELDVEVPAEAHPEEVTLPPVVLDVALMSLQLSAGGLLAGIVAGAAGIAVGIVAGGVLGAGIEQPNTRSVSSALITLYWVTPWL